jgi:hypothetical protein
MGGMGGGEAREREREKEIYLAKMQGGALSLASIKARQCIATQPLQRYDVAGRNSQMSVP